MLCDTKLVVAATHEVPRVQLAISRRFGFEHDLADQIHISNCGSPLVTFRCGRFPAPVGKHTQSGSGALLVLRREFIPVAAPVQAAADKLLAPAAAAVHVVVLQAHRRHGKEAIESRC